MRIAYLINQYPKVSHTFIRREILALERQGIEVMRIALRGWDAELVDSQDHLERERTRYVLRDGAWALLWAVVWAGVTRPLPLIRTIALAWRMSRHAERPLPVHLAYVAEACCILRWLSSSQVQHLHAHFGTNSAEVAMLVHGLGGPKWSFTVHGPEEFDKQTLIGLSEKVKRCVFVVAISSFGRSQLFRITDFDQWQKIKLIRCGIDEMFLREATTDVPAVNRFVCVGRLCEQKGQALLVQAAERLAQRKREFEIILIGDGEMRASIEELIARSNLQTRVRITGWIDSGRVRGEIINARTLVLPSFAEGLPIVLMEAMALGRPVISTFVGGIPELVHPGEHGWLVPAGDIESLTVALESCLDAPLDHLTRMGLAAHKRVLAEHDVSTAAAQLKDLFRSGT